MRPATLEDHLRRATRNFTSRLSEDEVFALGVDLARELAAAHAETPARHPPLEPSAIEMRDGRVALTSGDAGGSASEDLLRLGALLNSLALGEPPHVSWRLDGPPPVAATTLLRRGVLAALASPRRETRFATAEAAAGALELARSAAEPTSPWPMFRGDAARTGMLPGAAMAPKALTRLWDAPLGAVVAAPVIAEPFVIAATTNGRLVFLDRASGRRVHEVGVGSAIESSPAVAGRLLYVGSDDGELVACDVVTGSVEFRSRLGQVVRSSPLVLERVVVVGAVDGKAAGALCAVDGSTGKLVWRRKLGGAVFSSPAASRAMLFVGADDGALHAIEPVKGALVWSHKLRGRVRATPLLAGDVLIAADFAGVVTALRASDGSELWTRETGHPIYSSPCLVGGLVAFGCHDGHLRALDRNSGEPRHEIATGGPVVASPVSTGEALLFGSTDGDAYLVAASGALLARLPLSKAGIQSTACLAGDVAYLGTSDGITALRLES
jgi:outer membrane protein assembly factor BamB